MAEGGEGLPKPDGDTPVRTPEHLSTPKATVLDRLRGGLRTVSETFKPKMEQVPLDQITREKIATTVLSLNTIRGGSQVFNLGTVEDALGWTKPVSIEERQRLQQLVRGHLYSLVSGEALHSRQITDKDGSNPRFIFEIAESDRQRLTEIANTKK